MQVTRSLKEAAKKGDKDVCMILAKEVVHARKTVNKLHAAKVSLIYLHVFYEFFMIIILWNGGLRMQSSSIFLTSML